MTSNITSEELFQRVEYIATAHDVTMSQRLKILHETLVLTCAAGLSDDGQPAGNLFSKVDLLCKRLRISTQEAVAIQRMRHDSNRSGEQQPQVHGIPSQETVSREQLAYDCRSLAVFISAVFNTPIPGTLLRHIPVSLQPDDERRHIDARCLRCVVRSVEGGKAHVETTAGEGRLLHVALDKQPYLTKLLRADMQVNMLDVQLNGDEATAMIIVEPDFLVDISSLARCFTDYGHSPLNYTVNRLSPIANSQAILLGNFAGSALDDIINQGENYKWQETFKANFHERALEYCTCPDLNQRADFKQQAQAQVHHIEDAVDQLFGEYDRTHAILEPSFVCEQLGLQGRVDLMTTDLLLLVEQKSGSNWYIQTERPGKHGGFQKEDHYVQVLLYYEVLRRNFQLGYNKIDGKLLYSKYPMPSGLVPATYYKDLIRQALDLRNRIVGYEFIVAQKGFSTLLPHLSVDRLNERHLDNTLWTGYLLPQLTGLLQPLQQLSSLEHDYFCRMMTFVYREQLAARLGVEEGHGGAMADLWNMPLSEKKETGNIYTGLTIIHKEQSSHFNGYDMLTLAVSAQGVDFLPNFREGDAVYLYPYIEGQQPDVRRSILFKGQLVSIDTHRLIVHLSDGQQNPDIFEAAGHRNLAGHITVKWCIEHSYSDSSTTASIRSLYQMITDMTGHRELLLCQRAPRRDASLTLSRSYSSTYDDVILRAKQALDMFLLIGPPGTGKTSMALQFLVREASAGSPATTGSQSPTPTANILLMAYTNRAVDEICEMLTDNGIDYLRIGNRYTCAAPYRDHLIDEVLEQYQSLKEVRDRIITARIIVGTTSTIQNRTYLFALKHFHLTIIDEASQILEPQIVGLLTKADKFILIGDYKQLPAVVAQRPRESAVSEPSLQDIALTDCRSSLFQRLIENELRHGRTDFIGTLNRQGRMHPDVATFSCKAFYQREQIRPVPLPHQLETSLGYDMPSLDATDDLLKQHRVLFFPSQFCREPGISDKVNADEARIVAGLVLRIARFYNTKFDAQKTVGIIVPYRNQIAMIRQAIERLTEPDDSPHDGRPDGLQLPQKTVQQLKDIAIDTVERYQGSQRDVIIYSFTIQQRYQLDFLAANTIEENGCLIDRKLNVALTRARRQLLLTGNPDILRHNPLFRELIEHVTKGGIASRQRTEAGDRLIPEKTINIITPQTSKNMNHIFKTTAVYFSPTKSSKQVALTIAGHLCDGQSDVCDLTYLPVSPRSFHTDECVVIAAPVYGGHIPATARERLCQLHGNDTPAVAVVTYGNRDYEQALTDLADILHGQGFRVIAAATFIGEHSYCTDKYPIGKGRPDRDDLDCAAHFGDTIRKKIQEGNLHEVDVTTIPRPATSPDDTRAFIEGIQQMKQKATQQATAGPAAPAVPVTDTSLCTLCGSCVRLCPTEAIHINGSQLLTDPAHCIKCCACVKGCPSHARTFSTPFAPLLSAIFTTRKDPCTLV